MMETWVLGHPERWPWAVLTWLVGAGLVWLAYRGVFRAAGGGAGRRWLALAAVVKLLLWAVLAVMVCDPLRVTEVARRDANEVVVAVANSLRMELPVTAAGETAGQQVKQALEKGASWLEELETLFRLRWVEVGDRLKGLNGGEDLRFDGTSGRVLNGVRALRQGGQGGRLGAVVLLTEGHASDAGLVEELVAAGGAPVYPVRVERQGEVMDLSIREVAVAQTPFEDTPVTVTVGVKALGWSGKAWQALVVDEAGKVMGHEQQTVRTAEERGVARIKLKGVKPGLTFFRVLIAEAGWSAEQVVAGGYRVGEKQDEVTEADQGRQELTYWNNERRVLVDRGMGPYRVLYVAGRPNWEYKFLRRALAGDPEIQMPALIRIAKREPKFEWRGRAGETSNPLFRGFGAQEAEEVQRYDQPVLVRMEAKDAEELRDGFPKTAAELMGAYRAIVLDDVEAAFFTQEQQRLIESFVKDRGGALITLGGQESYHEGGYQHTPIGRMLPVYPERPARQEAVEGARWNLTREGWLEPALRLRAAEGEEEQRLAEMPGFYAVNAVGSIKPGAALLATLGDDETAALPALVSQRFGAGRVTSLLVADVWRWGMRDEASREDMEKFWRQLFRWSLVDVPDRLELQVTAANAVESRVKRLALRVRDAAFEPMDDATVRFEVQRDAGEKVVVYGEPSLREPGLFEADWVSHEVGNYQVEAVVERAPEVADEKAGAAGSDAAGGAVPMERLGSQTAGWVHDPVAELTAEVIPVSGWMERLAEGTGGKVLSLAELNKLPELLRERTMPVMDRMVEPLWHGALVFVLLLGLMIGEWLLRRKAGLT